MHVNPGLFSGAVKTDLQFLIEEIDELEDGCDYRKFADKMRDLVRQELDNGGRMGFKMLHPAVISHVYVNVIGDQWVAVTYEHGDHGEEHFLTRGLYMGEDQPQLHQNVWHTIARELS